MTVTLGTWHPYKQANIVIWKQWAERIFAPLFHDLIPGAKFKIKNRLVVISTFLTYIRLAYPSFKAALKDAIAFCTAHDSRRTELSHLVDLRRLITFFIPAVSQLISLILMKSLSLLFRHKTMAASSKWMMARKSSWLRRNCCTCF